MAYVPPSAEYVGYVNYDQAYSVTGNSSLFGLRPLIEFTQLGFVVIPLDVVYEVAIQLPESQYSGSAIVVELTANKHAALSRDLAAINGTRLRPPLSYDGYAVYDLLMQEVGGNTTIPGYVALVGHYMIFSNDKTSGLLNVQAILDQVTVGKRSFFDDENVKRSVFATGLTDQNYVALFVGRFATELNDTEMATKSIIGNGGSIQVTRAFLFPSSDIALSRWAEAHKVYRDAASYQILDSWLVVTYDYPIAEIQAEMIGI
jgi:hypothetical protein